MKEIKGHLQMINKQEIEILETRDEENESSGSGRILTRVEQLIAEIQSGYKIQPRPELSSPRGPSSEAIEGKGAIPNP